MTTIHITKKYLSDLPGLVVSSEQSHPVWPPSFEHHQPGEGLEAVVAAVHEVAHEDVVGVGRRPALPEQLLQVVELAVDIAADGDGAADQSEMSMGPARDQPITAHLDTGWMLLSSSSRSHTSSQSCFSSFSGRYLQS